MGQQMAATNGYTPGAGQRPLHRRRHDHRLDVGDPRHLRVHLRDVPGSSGSGGGFYPPDEQIVPQTTRNREAVLLLLRVRRLPLPGDRQAGPVLRRRRRHDRLLRHLRDRDRLDRQPERHRHRDHRRLGARRPGRHQLVRAPSSSAPRSAARTTSSPGASAGAAAGDFDIDGGTTIDPVAGHHPAGQRHADPDLLVVPGPRQQLVVGRLPPGQHRPQWRHDRRCSTGPARPPTRTRSGRSAAANLTPYAGQSVRILIAAADASTASLVEAASTTSASRSPRSRSPSAPPLSVTCPLQCQRRGQVTLSCVAGPASLPVARPRAVRLRLTAPQRSRCEPGAVPQL